MTLEQLRIFVAVAERLHVTRAAEALHLTQSAVSAAVSALETRHAVTLFDRVGRRIELTEAGRLFLEEARGVLARAAAAERVLDELAGLARGTLTLCASQTIANYWLPARLVAFRRAHPAIAVQVAIGNTAEVAKAVLDGTADLGLAEGQVDDAALAVTALPGDRLTLVVGAGHAWNSRAAVEPRDLATVPWVLREPGSGTRSEFEETLARHGLGLAALTVALELPSNEAVRAAVEAGAGATAISRLVAAPGLAAGLLHEVAFPFPERPFHLLRHRQRHLSGAAAAFIDLLPTA